MKRTFNCMKVLRGISFFRLAIFVGAIYSLAGCSVITGVYDENTYTIKPTNLNIVRSQPLEIYFERLLYLSQKDADIAAWRSTQLFSSVTETTVDQPSALGYFLRVSCEGSGWSSIEDTPVTSFMLSVLSGFIVPLGADYARRDCNLTMYENGIQIANDNIQLEYRKLSASWILLPYYFKRPSIYATHAQTEANIRVRNMMAVLTKEAK